MADGYDLLDIKQAAELLKVTETTLRRWTNTGRLACLRLGAKRERRFRRSDLLAFLEHQPARGRAGAESLPQGPGPAAHHGHATAQGSHLCALYSSDLGRNRLAVEFLAEGLRAGDACYLLATPSATRETLDGLEQRHGRLQPEIAAGRLVLSEYLPSGAAQLRALQARMRDSIRRGNRSMRLVGAVSEGSLAAGKRIDDVLRFEAGYDRLLARRFPLLTLCQYDVRSHSGIEVCEVLRRHPDVFAHPVDRLLY